MAANPINSKGENVDDIDSLTRLVNDLSGKVDWWNSAIIVAMIGAAFAATALVATQFIAFRRAGQLAAAQGSLGLAKDRKLSIELKDKDRQIAELGTKAGEANERATTAEQHSAEANAKAEGFRLDIAKSNEAAAQAQAQVAGAMAEAARANLELAKLKTPRNLTPEQREQIRVAISQFSGTPYDIWVSTDSDSAVLMEQIDAALRTAGWEFHASGTIQFGGKAGIISGNGVSVHFPVELSDKLAKPALALAAALKAAGIPQETVYADGLDFNKDFDRTRIHVWIGSKPLN
jgi:hypothetical protein